MDDTNLLFIGAILSVALGGMALRLVRANKKLDWNEAIAAHILCLMFITKGIQNAATAYFNQALESSETHWQFWVSISMSMDYIFTGSAIAIALLYPVPLLRTIKQVKVGLSLIGGFTMFCLILDVVGLNLTAFGLPGLLYYAVAIIWGGVYVKFRLIDPEKRNDSTRNVALVSGLFMTLILGHVWMWWPGLILQSNYFYFFDLGGGALTSTLWDFMWLSGYAIGIGAGLTMLGIEIYLALSGDGNKLLYVLLPYFVLGLIGYSIYSKGDDAGFIIDTSSSEIIDLWSVFTTSLHFTVIRPIIAMYILLKFGLFDIDEDTKPMAKLMSIILIVVATSALLELLQSILPINQMISAALLGIIIALGLGWEEKSFHRLVTNPANMRIGLDKKWFPELDIPRKYISRIDVACMIYCIIAVLVAFLIWKMDIIIELATTRMGGAE